MDRQADSDGSTDGGTDPRRGKGNFWGLSGHSEALAIFAVMFAATGIIQLPIMSCHHLLCQASANSIPKIYGYRRCSLLAMKGVVVLHSTVSV